MLKHDYEIQQEQRMKRILENTLYVMAYAVFTAVTAVTLAGMALPA